MDRHPFETRDIKLKNCARHIRYGHTEVLCGNFDDPDICQKCIENYLSTGEWGINWKEKTA